MNFKEVVIRVKKRLEEGSEYGHTNICCICPFQPQDCVEALVKELKKIIEELGEEPSQREIDRLLDIKGSVNAKLTFDEFLDFMKKVYGEGSPNPEKKVQRTGKTVTQTTTTVTTRIKGGTIEKSTKTTSRSQRRF